MIQCPHCASSLHQIKSAHTHTGSYRFIEAVNADCATTWRAEDAARTVSQVALRR
jgi:hypothetical protein